MNCQIVRKFSIAKALFETFPSSTHFRFIDDYFSFEKVSIELCVNFISDEEFLKVLK